MTEIYYRAFKRFTIFLSGKNFGTVLAQPLTGILCEYGFDGGWPSVFYVFGKKSWINLIPF